MKIAYFLLGLPLCIFAQMQYPQTQKTPVSTNYFETVVEENYQWLEDDRASNTKEWVLTQNNYTQNYLAQLPKRDQIKKDLQKLVNYPKISMPFKKGKYLYYYKNEGLQQHSVLYRKLGLVEEIFIDPNTFSEDGSISLAGLYFSKDYSKVAYQISKGGSDWHDVVVMDVESKKIIEDKVKNVKFTGISWYNNDAYFYSTYPTPNGSQLSAKTQNHHVFYHQLFAEQSSDKSVFGDDNQPKRYVFSEVSEDQKYLIVKASNNTSGNELYLINLQDKEWKPQTILADDSSNTDYFFNEGNTFYFYTDIQAPNYKLAKFQWPDNTGKPNWMDVIPTTENVLNVSKAGDKIFAHYQIDVNDQVEIYDYQGKKLGRVNLPGKGSVAGFNGEKDDNIAYFYFENYITPTTVYAYDIAENSYSLYQTSKIQFNPSDFITEQVFYTSFDGTKIPITISYKKGTPLNGKTPTILYGYGGFNISLKPAFSIYIAYWLQMGGIYAVPNIRGGGEYGNEWHDAGTKLQKKNVFNDFIAAGQFLKEKGYTNTQNLAIYGGSNGGLLVGAVMTMQPDFCAVALPAVGVLDMLKYNKFTSGAGWAYDYGTAEDSKEMFDYLYSYSPVHNVKANTCYPATMITTGDHDDRVVPAHSFKFAAELQDKQSCNNPILIRIETKAGHGAGKSTSTLINENADRFAFIWANLQSTKN